MKSKQANCFWCGSLCDKTYRIMMEELLAVTKKPKYLCEKCQKQLHDNDRYPTKSGQNSTNNGPIPSQVKEEKMVYNENPYPSQLHPDFDNACVFFIHPAFGVYYWAWDTSKRSGGVYSSRLVPLYGYYDWRLSSLEVFPDDHEGSIKIYKTFEDARVACAEVIKYIKENKKEFEEFIREVK